MTTKDDIPEVAVLQENPILLDRLYKAAKAYYLMKEESFYAAEGATVKIHSDLIKDEIAAALVAVTLITEQPAEITAMSGEMGKLQASLRYHADRRKEWSVAQMLLNRRLS